MQVLGVEAAVIAERGELDGIQLLGGGVVQEFDALPLKGAYRIGVEAEFDGNFFGGGGGKRSGGDREGLEEGATKHEDTVTHF